MFFNLINYVKSYVTIKVEGLFPERFINLCTQNRIEIRNIRRISETNISAHITAKDFKKLRKISKKSKCKVHITDKHGIRFLIYKYRKRKMLFAGFILFILFLWSMTQFVWLIEITGNEKTEDAAILECAKKAGLRPGIPTVAVDTKKIRDYIISNMDEIAFITVNRTGTTVNIDVREREEKREHFDKTSTSNIVADQSGVIESILVQSGTGAVKKGDIVYKGQLLVSGAADNSYLGIKYSNSDARVMARVWHEKTVDLPYRIEEKISTGNEKILRKLVLFDFSLNLFIKNKILFEKYDILSYTNYISLGEGKVLPIGVETTTYREYKIKLTELTEEQTKKVLTEEFNELYKESEIVSRSFEKKDDKLTVIYECIEEIGREEEMNDNRKISGS